LAHAKVTDSNLLTQLMKKRLLETLKRYTRFLKIVDYDFSQD